MSTGLLAWTPSEIRHKYIALIPSVIEMGMNVGPQSLLELTQRYYPGTLGTRTLDSSLESTNKKLMVIIFLPSPE